MIEVKELRGFPSASLGLKEMMPKIQRIATNTVTRNFDLGGRPPWTALGGQRSSLISKDSTPLIASGALYKSIAGFHGENFAGVEAGRGLGKYPFVHQFGGTWKVNITQKMRGFFWMMFYKTGEEQWKWMALSRRAAFVIHVPARPYMVLQPEDLVQILDLVGRGLIKFSFDGEMNATIDLE